MCVMMLTEMNVVLFLRLIALHCHLHLVAKNHDHSTCDKQRNTPETMEHYQFCVRIRIKPLDGVWRDVSGVRHSYSSRGGPTLGPSTHILSYNCLQQKFQGIHYSVLVPSLVACIWRIYTNIYKIKKKYLTSSNVFSLSLSCRVLILQLSLHLHIFLV